MIKMGVINLTPDSFYEPSRYNYAMLEREDVQIIDVGAVSTRPGAPDVELEEEWRRLEPFLRMWAMEQRGKQLSIDTTRAEIVRRAYEVVGPFIVNDISAGHDDPQMLPTVGRLGLTFIAMHKRGNPRTMDSLADPETDIIAQLLEYFRDFEEQARAHGISDWILDPGLGFAKTERQNIEIIERLGELTVFGRPILIGVADKRFTHGDTAKYEKMGAENGAHILRIH